MGTGLSKEQRIILGVITDKSQQGKVSNISQICEALGIGHESRGYCTRRWIVSDTTRRKSIWRSLRRLEVRGLINNLGRGLGNEERWVSINHQTKVRQPIGVGDGS